MNITLDGQTLEALLEDHGTLDTVVSVWQNGKRKHTVVFSQEYAIDYRQREGGLKDLFTEAVDDYLMIESESKLNKSED